MRWFTHGLTFSFVKWLFFCIKNLSSSNLIKESIVHVEPYLIIFNMYEYIAVFKIFLRNFLNILFYNNSFHRPGKPHLGEDTQRDISKRPFFNVWWDWSFVLPSLTFVPSSFSSSFILSLSLSLFLFSISLMCWSHITIELRELSIQTDHPSVGNIMI